MRTVLAALVHLFTLSPCDNAHILALQPLNTKSHVIVTMPLFEELASRGHNVTLLTYFPHETPIPNLFEIDISHTQNTTVSSISLDVIKELMPYHIVTSISMLNVEMLMCELVFQDDSVKRLLKSDEKFDLIMTEAFAADCFVPFAHKFNAPLITFVTSIALPWVADRVGLPDNPSYIVNYFLGLSPEMNFFQRLYNTAVYAYTKLVHEYYFLPNSDRFIRHHFGDSTPPLKELLKNTSMLFINSHFSLSQSRPFPPNVLEIGGIHLENSEKLRSLPKDLQDVLDNATQGVIMMSFGSLVKVSSIPRHIILAFMKAFSTLPQTVLFKYEEELPEAPSNVIIRKWLPQKEILGHRNVKAVIGHGGLASTIEAVYFGIPFVGIPFFCDQYSNVNSVVRRGAGISLELEYITEQSILAALREVLENPKYKEGMRRLSEQYRDRPMTALQSAVYWTEYVIRHQGAHHLRPASVSLSLYQYLLLDVIALLLIIVSIVFFAIYRVLKMILKSICTTQNSSSRLTSSLKKSI